MESSEKMSYWNPKLCLFIWMFTTFYIVFFFLSLFATLFWVLFLFLLLFRFFPRTKFIPFFPRTKFILFFFLVQNSFFFFLHKRNALFLYFTNFGFFMSRQTNGNSRNTIEGVTKLSKCYENQDGNKMIKATEKNKKWKKNHIHQFHILKKKNTACYSVAANVG